MKCSFCSLEIAPGTGMLFVDVDGTQRFFCSKKCEKHLLKLGRKALSTKWTQRKTA